MVNKVPEVTIYFWIVKIIATILGETGADFISVNLNIGLTGTTYVIRPLLLTSLLLQIRSRKYVPWIYWSNVALISIGGTLITDKLVDNLGISLVTTTDIFSGAVLVTFAARYASERTLSIHVINTTQRELFYWCRDLLVSFSP